MQNIISFSGGKDSSALILWAKENLDNFEVVFCDTGWEHEITYSYIDYINQELLNGSLIKIKSEKYEGFEDMSIKRKRVPSTMARFCTQELKLFPMHKYIHEEYNRNVELYVGIRKDESLARSKMQKRNFDLDYYGCWINRPLIDWTANDTFEIMHKYNIEPNPLYKKGMRRVGCMPCIMASNKELKNIFKNFPEVIEKIKNLENKIGRTFFPATKIPERFRSSFDEKSGEKIAFIDDVVKYLTEIKEDKNQDDLFEPPSCMSFYNICE